MQPQSITENSRVRERVLEILRGFLTELGSDLAQRRLGLQAALDRDLGIGSLEKVELLLRLEAEFSVRLPETAISEARTPEDLCRLLLHSRSPDLVPEPTHQPAEEIQHPPSASLAQLRNLSTLQAALQLHARISPERPQVLLELESGTVEAIRYRALESEASAVACGLLERGLNKGETVAILLPTGADFFRAFLGVWFAGGVAVPLYPPFRADQVEDYAKRQLRVLANAGARILITFHKAERLMQILRPSIPGLAAVVTLEDLSRHRGGYRSGANGAEEPALIQYTSGSTAAPKGVVLTHSNLLANIRACGASLQIEPTDVGVSWLPLYHDMGLIGSWLTALYFAVPIVILSPLTFLSRPERWLWAIHRHRGTLSAAPNFAYELCARRIPKEALEGLDLSSWRVALNGAEPVSPDTLQHFTERFTPYGFKAKAFLPVYGLAESSVALTFPPLNRTPRVDVVDREALTSEKVARPVRPETASSQRFVSVGRPLPGHEVRIVDESGLEVPERVQGHIQFRGPSSMQGYFRNPEATLAAQYKGWLKSGDLGYWADGELFVTGRQKDLIIKGGRNLYPQEIEELAAQIDGVRRGCVAAFGVADEKTGSESLVVVVETRVTVPEARDDLTASVLARIEEEIGIPPDRVVLAPPHTVPKTSSGKIQRSACRQLYLSGKLRGRQRPVWTQTTRLLLASIRHHLKHWIRRGVDTLYGIYVWVVLAGVMLCGRVLLLLPTAIRRVRPKAIYRGMCRVALKLTGLIPEVSDPGGFLTKVQQRTMGDTPLLLVSNHASYMDVVVLGGVLPFDFLFVAKREAMTWPVVGAFIRSCGFLTVDRGDLSRAAGTGAEIDQALRSGQKVHIFPEATFTPHTGIRPLQLGAFKSSVKAGCPIVPVTLRGTRQVFRDGSWLLRFGPVQVTISPPLHPSADSLQEMVRLRDAVRAEFSRHSGESPLDLVLAGLPKDQDV
ncbi:MAG: AMP-binding protein [Acidobacteriota bacterium]